jgi:hypothetical protein
MTERTNVLLRQPGLRTRQTGATLIVGLVLLLVLTVLAVSGMNTATMEVTMAGNTQFQQDAFQMAEDGIDVVIGRREYATDADRTILIDGCPDDLDAGDCRAVTSFEANLPVITNGARRCMHDWLPHKVAEEYAMSPDWDDRWRTGGSVDEVKVEAHIDPAHLLEGIREFASKREERLRLLGHPG